MSERLRQKVTLSPGEQARLARRTAALLGTGMGISEGLSFVTRSMSGRKRKMMDGIIEEISHGRTCSEMFSESAAFDKSFVHMVAMGEKSGSLESAFSESAFLLEKRQALSRKIYGAFVYPGFIACATLGIAVFLVAYIFPKIVPLITSMNIPLPFLTRLLIFVSHSLIYHWLAIFLVLTLSCGCIFSIWKYILLVRRAWAIFYMGMPLLGTIVRSKTLIDVFKPLGLLLTHGEHVPEALVSVAGIIANAEYAEALREGSLQVIRGESFAACISAHSHLFPQLVADFLETGERTGGIGTACGHIAALYESEMDQSVRHISTIIEPALMLGMGIVVGGIALSIVMPIYEITSTLSK